MNNSRSRRWYAVSLGILGIALVVVGVHVAPGWATSPDQIKVNRGTNIAATVSPDFASIVFDLQGVLWSLPIAGGTATPLTQPLLEPARPDYAPRGGFVAFEAYSGGTFHIWAMDPDGRNVRQLTSGHADDRDPRVSPNGSKIAYSSDNAVFGSNYVIRVVDVASRTSSTVASDATFDAFEPTWSPDGNTIAFVNGTGATGTSIQSVPAGGGTRTTLVTAPAGQRLNSPAYSPGGGKIAYVQFGTNNNVSQSQLWVKDLSSSGSAPVRVGTSNDVFPFYPVWLSETELLYTADGKIEITTIGGGTTDVPFEATFPIMRDSYTRKKFDFDSADKRQVVGIVGPALSPDAKQVAFEALNQIWLMEIGKKPRPITADTYYKCDPAWSPDGTKLAYSTDKSGIMKVYVYDVRTGRGDETAVTTFGGAQVSAAWSR
ncbi:MAG: amidohydrolase, partial [Deltaproteobacteria bacterium]